MTSSDKLFLKRHGLPENASTADVRAAIDKVLDQAISSAKQSSSQRNYLKVENGPGGAFSVVFDDSDTLSHSG